MASVAAGHTENTESVGLALLGGDGTGSLGLDGSGERDGSLGVADNLDVGEVGSLEERNRKCQ